MVSKDAAPVPGAYVRLLDGTGEFTAEVVTSATGDFRFFAAPGEWTLSVMHKDGSGRRIGRRPRARAWSRPRSPSPDSPA